MYSDASVIITVRIFKIDLKDLIEKVNDVMRSLGCERLEYETYKTFDGSVITQHFYEYKNATWYRSEKEAIDETNDYVKYTLTGKAISAIMNSEYKEKIRIVKSFNPGVVLNIYKKEDRTELMLCKNCPRFKEDAIDKKEKSITDWVRKFIEANPWYDTLQNEYDYKLCLVSGTKTPFGDGTVFIEFEHPDKPRISVIVYLDDHGAVNDVSIDLYNRYDLDAIGAICHLLDGLRNLWP